MLRVQHRERWPFKTFPAELYFPILSVMFCLVVKLTTLVEQVLLNPLSHLRHTHVHPREGVPGTAAAPAGDPSHEPATRGLPAGQGAPRITLSQETNMQGSEDGGTAHKDMAHRQRNKANACNRP